MSFKPLRFPAFVAVMIFTGLVTPVDAQGPKPPGKPDGKDPKPPATEGKKDDKKDDKAQPAEAPAPVVPPPVTSPATLNRLFNEAEKAFGDKDYFTAITKIQELLKALGPGKEAPYELLYFYIGLGNLLSNNLPEAEEAFKDCAKRYPNGEYTSRCQLGLGRALMLQESKGKKEAALGPLRKAAEDARFKSEAGFWLASVYTDLGRHDEALKILKSLMGSDVRSPQQTTAAVEAIRLMADGKLEDFAAYLERISNQPGVRDAIAWFTNQVIVNGDELMTAENYESALVVYRAVQPRNQILAIQNAALDTMRKNLKILEDRVEAERGKPLSQHTNAGELANALKPAIRLAETAMKTIEDKPDLDAAILMRRGRCLFYLKRDEEALTCFHALRERYPASPDAETAAYAEIIILNKRQDIEGIKEKCDLFMRKFPNSERIEQVATLAGEVLVQSGKWTEVGNFYRGLESKFPKSENMERYVFYQAVSFFQQALLKDSTPLFERFLKNYPNSDFVETASYYVAMSNFLSNDYKKTLASCRNYLAKYPGGRYAGDMQYRLSFIDFNDKETNQNDKIIRDLGTFLKEHPGDLANGPMLCLMADTYRKKMELAKTDEDSKNYEKLALDCYDQAVWTESPDDVVQYALDTATSILKGRKDWKAVAELHGKFLKAKPQSPLALISATEVAKGYAREGRAPEAAELLGSVLKARIGDPSSEQVEYLIDELVKCLVPRKKASEIDLPAIDKQLTDLLNKIVTGHENATTAARIYYARARLAQLCKRGDLSDIYLKGIATSNASDPTGLSAALLSVCGDILLKQGDLEGAEKMYKRLKDRYSDSMYSDAGPVGLGNIALARKKPEEALRIFEDALENNAGTSKIAETTLGKLQALVELDKLESASTLAQQMVGDKLFRGAIAAKAYLQLALVYRKQAAKATGAEAHDFLAKAHGTYQRIYIAFQSLPDLCADAYWEAFEILKELGDVTQSQDTLRALAEHPKLQKTAECKKAREMIGISN